MAVDRDEIRRQITEGMKVVGVDGDELGTVKELYTDSFRVDRTLLPDLTLTYEKIGTISPGGIMLNVPVDRADEMTDEGAPPTRPPHAP